MFILLPEGTRREGELESLKMALEKSREVSIDLEAIKAKATKFLTRGDCISLY